MVFQNCTVLIAVLAFKLITLIDFVPQKKRIARFRIGLTQLPGPRLTAQQTARNVFAADLEMKDLVSALILKFDLADITGLTARHRRVVCCNRHFLSFN